MYDIDLNKNFVHPRIMICTTINPNNTVFFHVLIFYANRLCF